MLMPFAFSPWRLRNAANKSNNSSHIVQTNSQTHAKNNDKILMHIKELLCYSTNLQLCPYSRQIQLHHFSAATVQTWTGTLLSQIPQLSE